MSNELKYLGKLAAAGRLDRRAFLGRAAALGVTTTIANTMLAGAARAADPVKGGVMRLGLGGGQSTDSFDPALASNEAPNTMLSFFGERLFEVSPEGDLVSRLAVDHSSSPDARVWTFKIRKDVPFHNGKTVTPEDVMATMERHSDESSQSGALGLVQGIKTMRVENDEFIVELKEANADLPFVLADYHLVIQPNGGKDNPAEGVSAGPYKVIEEDAGVRYIFEKFADYWDDSRGHVDRIEVLVINDDSARVSAVQSGQVHMINRVPPRIATMMKRAPGVEVKSVPSRGHYVYVMHCNTAPFNNNDLRMALKYAINREEMLDKILFGHGTIGNDTPINAAYPLFSDDIEQREYDPEKAAFHYKKSGHEGPIVFRTSDVAFPGALDAAQLYQQSAAEAGMQLDVIRSPGDGYWSEVWNKEPFCNSYWNGRPTQDMMLSTSYQTGADWNETKFSNPEFDKLLVQARGELDEDKRRDMYRRLNVILRDEGGVICPMFNNFVDAISDQVEGWHDDPNFPLMNALAPVKCWLKA
ncbi:ABC transporter substrate-binding protein [Pontibaca salina]|uniref:ABC transporter substrate-binding protein n=1 Tax=Pontibaca salina TaxID=2795731 RepID=A0A934LZX6_9RHOB|nr:ABC transporter substrate-binding protein [Pontibaca salina]MBI6629440.1 ABC transporter substrate-binding protein [Pontibaca salina]